MAAAAAAPDIFFSRTFSPVLFSDDEREDDGKRRRRRGAVFDDVQTPLARRAFFSTKEYASSKDADVGYSFDDLHACGVGKKPSKRAHSSSRVGGRRDERVPPASVLLR